MNHTHSTITKYTVKIMLTILPAALMMIGLGTMKTNGVMIIAVTICERSGAIILVIKIRANTINHRPRTTEKLSLRAPKPHLPLTITAGIAKANIMLR